jgi:biotin carboxyl carrier protein
VKNGPNTKHHLLTVNGREFPIEIKDELDIMIKDLGLDAMEDEIDKEIKAPMPGLVIDICISKGDLIKTGENLIILEAMKMENILKSPGEAKVKSVNIQKGETVDKDQVLIELV